MDTPTPTMITPEVRVSVCSRKMKEHNEDKTWKVNIFALVCNIWVWKAMKCVKMWPKSVQFWWTCFLTTLSKKFFFITFCKPQQQPNFLFGYVIVFIIFHQDFSLLKILSDWLTTDILITCHLHIVFCFTLMFPWKLCIQQQAKPEFCTSTKRTVSQSHVKGLYQVLQLTKTSKMFLYTGFWGHCFNDFKTRPVSLVSISRTLSSWEANEFMKLRT